MKRILLAATTSALLFGTACNSEKKEQPQDQDITELQEKTRESNEESIQQDSARIAIMKSDKSTIGVTDIDPADATFTSRTKTLYETDKGEKMAAVFGYKKTNEGSIAIIQKEGGAAIKLPFSKEEEGNLNFSDGKTTLISTAEGAILIENGAQKVYKKRI